MGMIYLFSHILMGLYLECVSLDSLPIDHASSIHLPIFELVYLFAFEVIVDMFGIGPAFFIT